MSKRISDRMLERARLGELPDDEVRALVRRLEVEEGGAARLEQLIEEDVAFLERYPAPVMAAQIRERARREQRGREREERSERPLRRAGWAFAIATAVAAAIAVAVVAGRGTDDLGAPHADPLASTSDGGDSYPAGVSRDLVQPDPVLEPIDTMAEEASEAHWRRLGLRIADSGEMILEPGEEISFAADGVRSVSVDEGRVLEVTADEGTLTIRARETGLTGVRLSIDGDTPTFFVRVADPLDPERVDEIIERHRGGLAGCGVEATTTPSETDARMRILIGGERVIAAYFDQGALGSDTEHCVVRQTRGFEIEELPELRVASVWVRPLDESSRKESPPVAPSKTH